MDFPPPPSLCFERSAGLNQTVLSHILRRSHRLGVASLRLKGFAPGSPRMTNQASLDSQSLLNTKYGN